MGLTNFCFVTLYALHKPVYFKKDENKSFVSFTGAIPQFTRGVKINGKPEPIPESIKVRLLAFGDVGKRILKYVNQGSLINIQGNIIAYNFVNQVTTRKDFYNVINIKDFQILNKESEEHKANRYAEDIEDYLKEQEEIKKLKRKDEEEK